MEQLVPLAAIFFLFGMPVIAWIFFRVLAHRERMEMLRQGMVPDKLDRKRWVPGTPPPVATATPYVADPGWTPDAAHAALRKAITITMIGFALTIGLSFIGLDGDSWRPGPWLLGGLVPLFVGLAQLIMALMSGATLRPNQTWSMPPAAPPPPYTAPTPPPAGATTYDGSYTYRPGAAQELRPPSSPPDRR
jgi:hypothetical protein